MLLSKHQLCEGIGPALDSSTCWKAVLHLGHCCAVPFSYLVADHAYVEASPTPHPAVWVPSSRGPVLGPKQFWFFSCCCCYWCAPVRSSAASSPPPLSFTPGTNYLRRRLASVKGVPPPLLSGAVHGGRWSRQRFAWRQRVYWWWPRRYRYGRRQQQRRRQR